MTAALEQLRAGLRRVAGVNALTGPLLEQQLDLVATYEAGMWRRWRKVPQTAMRRYYPHAAALVVAIERRHAALEAWAPHAALEAWAPHAARGAAP